MTEPVCLCECGCGQPTVISPHTDRWHGWIRGQPRRFLAGHNNRLRIVGYEPEDRGYTTPCWIWQGSLNHAGYCADRVEGVSGAYRGS